MTKQLIIILFITVGILVTPLVFISLMVGIVETDGYVYQFQNGKMLVSRVIVK